MYELSMQVFVQTANLSRTLGRTLDTEQPNMRVPHLPGPRRAAYWRLRFTLISGDRSTNATSLL